jgi:multiple sugar transport system substrate-binding protein
MSGWGRRVGVSLAAVAACAVAATAAGARTDSGARQAAGPLNIYGFDVGDDVQENRATYAASQMPSNVTIKRLTGSFNDQVFLTRLASGDIPDLVKMERTKVATYAAKGVIRPMDDCVSSVKSQYRVGALKAMTYQGHIYGLPQFTQPVMMYINLSAMKSAGLTVKDAQTTNKKALLATVKKLVKFDGSGNLTRIAFDPKIDSGFGLPLWTKWFGKDVISKDGLKAQLNSKEAVAAMAFAVQVINAQGGWNKFKAFKDTFDWFGRQNPLVKDQIGFVAQESFFLNSFSNNSPDVDLAAGFFTNRKGGPISWFSGDGWVVPTKSGNVNDACDYMKAVTSQGAWLKAASERYEARRRTGSTFTGLYTANAVADRKVYEDVYQSFGKAQFDRAVQIAVAAGRYGLELPPSPGGQQFVQSMNDAVQRVLAGQQTPKQALDQAQKEAQTAIDANKK